MKISTNLQKMKAAAMTSLFMTLFTVCLFAYEVKAANHDYMSTAMPIRVNQEYDDALEKSADINWYEFTLTESGYISFEFDHEFVSTNSVCWNAYLYDAEENEIDLYRYKGSEKVQTGPEIGLPAGTYYVKVNQGISYKEAVYTLKVKFNPSSHWETEFNDYKESADSIKTNDTYYGSIHSLDEKDWYEFTLPKDGIVSLEFTHEFVDTNANRWSIFLYDSEENKLEDYQSKGSVTTASSGKHFLKAGTYYVKVSKVVTISTVTYGIKVNYQKPISLKKCTISLEKSSCTYTGKTIKPSVTVKKGSKKLVSGTDYTITYKNNKAVGKATVTITGTGDYIDTVTKTFSIIPKGTTISGITGKSKSFTVQWKKQSTQTTGYQIQYSLSSKFSSPTTVTIKDTKTLTKTISGLKAKKKYYVRIRTYHTVSGTKYCSSWSGASSVKTK